jgi:hypothetical protein
MSSLPWQLRLTQIFNALTPEQVQRREPYWREDDKGIHAEEQNSVVRLRSYASDGHDYRQELAVAAGEAVGTLLLGNDRNGSAASHITYGDVVLSVASTQHFKADELLWNTTPFNKTLNPTFGMPSGLAAAQDVFEVAKAATGLDSLETATDAISNIQKQVGDLSITGDADFSSPFNAYCSLTPQKLPLMNFGWIMFLQMLIKGMPLFLSTAAGAPIAPSPLLLSLQKLAKMQTTTGFGPSVEGTIIGKELKDTLLSSVPGIGAAFA